MMSQRKILWPFAKVLFRKSSPRRTFKTRLVARPLAAQVEFLEDRTLLSTSLGTAANFAILAGSTVTNTGPSVVTGDVGVSPGTAIVPGSPPWVVNGTIHAADAVALQAQTDLTTAYNVIAGKPAVDLTGQTLGATVLTLTPGAYKFSSSAQLTGTLTLNALGDPNAEFDFEIGSTLTTASNSKVVVINGGNPCSVFWQVGSSATLGTGTAFEGHILALASITLTTGASVAGSVLARNGAVTLDTNSISNADCTLGSISGHKFNDLNGSGVFVAGDPSLPGITIFLDTNNNGILDAGESSTITDASGNYSFSNLSAGTYIVREVQPAGMLQTTPNPGPSTLAPGQAIAGVNFGNFQLITISGMKFNDLNGSGIQQPGDPGLAGITIFLDLNHDGTLDPGDPSTTTGANGSYSFANLAPGTYTVREVSPAGSVQTTVNPANIAAQSGTNVGGVNFGNFQLITISGMKFNDLSGSGVQQPGDPGLAGITIFLDLNHDGKLDPGDPSTTTGANGSYSFANLAPGTYTVREVSPAGFTQTTANPANIAAQSGTNVGGVNFGNFQLITISGMKFKDLSGSGIRTAGDPGMSGVTIFLDTNNNGILDTGERSTITDANGNFSFANLAPGMYRVREVDPTNFVQMTNNPADIVATSGANVTNILFGDIPAANLFGAGKLQLTGQNLSNLLDGTFASQANFVANLYETQLGRAPDLAGLSYYLTLLMAGYTEQQVAGMINVNGQYAVVTPGSNTLTLASITQSGAQLTLAGTSTATAALTGPATLLVGGNGSATFGNSTITFSSGAFAGQVWTKLDLPANYTNSNNAAAHVYQNGTSLTFVVDPAGDTSPGYWISPTQVYSTAWGMVGTVGSNKITWSNGQVWTENLVINGSNNGSGTTTIVAKLNSWITHYTNSNNDAAHISQNGTLLMFVVDPTGDTSPGYWISPTQVFSTAWGMVGTVGSTGTVTWSNGQVWTGATSLVPPVTTHYTNSNNAAAHVSQSGTLLTFIVDPTGDTSPGYWISPTQVYATAWGMAGTVGSNKINWSNGQVWSGTTTITPTTMFSTSLTDSNGAISRVQLTSPTTLIGLDGQLQGLTATRLNGKLYWSNGAVWDNFDFNALNALFEMATGYPS